MSKYLSHLYIAGHYATTLLLCVILGLSVGGWVIVLTSNAVVPTLPINLGLVGTVNLVPILCLTPGIFAAIMLNLLPGANRVLRLELSHRRFEAGMHDVEEAYYRSHTADRAGTFRLTREFDAVRERERHLKSLPDLQGMEPEILLLAAQMGYAARDLAATFNDEKVAAARAFISTRLTEAEQFETQVEAMYRTIESIKSDSIKLTTIEHDAAARFERLKTEWDTLQQQYAAAKSETNVVAMMPATG